MKDHKFHGSYKHRTFSSCPLAVKIMSLGPNISNYKMFIANRTHPLPNILVGLGTVNYLHIRTRLVNCTCSNKSYNLTYNKS